MSALVALVHRDGRPVDRAIVRRALEAQRARGPDSQAIWCEGPVAIGHAMLATTPEDALASQPFVARGGALVVALDGRIDNRAEIAEATGLCARDAPDVEVVAAAYARWGEAFASRLLGDFGVVLWDARRREVVIARDPLAARSLYVRDDGRTWTCASEPLALFAATGERPRPSFEAMALLLVEQYVERGETLIAGVEALLPGAAMCVPIGSEGRAPLVPRRGIAPSWPGPITTRRLASPDEHARELRGALREAVASRMRASGRIAAHVSGGLDSASVAALAREVARDRGQAPPLLIRCVFPGLACDETGESDAVAAHLGLPIESVEMPGDRGDFAFDERGRAPAVGGVTAPYENPISMMLVRMTERAKALGARVTLTGAGSDQLLLPTGHELSGALLRGDLRAAIALSGLGDSPLSVEPYSRLLREGLYRLFPRSFRLGVRRLRARAASRMSARRAAEDDDLAPWLTKAAREAIRARARSSSPLGSRRDGPTEAVRQLVARIAEHADYAYSLVLADRIAGARGAEMRHPFFDRRVIDLVLAYPDEIRTEAPPKKRLLRRAMGASIPARVRDRASAAEFSPLVWSALVAPHGERLARMLREGRLVAAGLVDPEKAVQAIERARAVGTHGPPVEAIRELLQLAWLEAWLRALDA